MPDPSTGYTADLGCCPTCHELEADCICPKLTRHYTWAEAVKLDEIREARRQHLITEDEAKRLRWKTIWATCISI